MFLSLILLAAAAFPLLLFLAVNLGYIPEIVTPFFSIPKLLNLRNGELNLGYVINNFARLFEIVTRQYDGNTFTSSSLTGAYYLFTTPFFLFGILFHIVKLFREHKLGNNDLQFIFLPWLISAVIVGLLQMVITTIHINLIHIPIIFYGVYGIAQAARLLKSRLMTPLCIAFFCISFGAFAYDYATDSDTHFYDDTALEALETAKDLAAPGQMITIVGYPTIQYGIWMWFEKPDPSDFYLNVTYVDNQGDGDFSTYGQFRYVYSMDQVTGEDVYICLNNASNLEILADTDLTVTVLNERYLIAFPDVSGAAAQ
ncbi:MAG: hypothetical protein NC121_10085 [Blautia sp.]|nr:hypothetical protein [Blautia sp.]